MKSISIKLTNPQNGEVSSNIYGQFIEHLGDCVYGGVYDDNTALTDENHIRTDVREKVKELAPPIIRFPGGTVMCIYHWEDAIGPLEQRKAKKNLIWGGILRPEFGTAEFVQYCRSVGAEPMICVNMASGTPEEAGNWVEYCNGTDNSYYANLRRSHGYEEPFGVKYWCIGNECYAEPDIGLQNDVNRYIAEAREFIKFMKLNDPTIQTVIVGGDDVEGWDKPVLDALQGMTDYLSYHHYDTEGGLGLYGAFHGQKDFAARLKELDALVESYPEEPVNFNRWYRIPPRQGKIKLLIDEWNIWNFQDDGIYGLHMTYNWRDAIWAASMLNYFIADPNVAGANMAQLCNIIAPIIVTKDGSYTQTIYTPCAEYRKVMYGTRLNAEIDGQFIIDGGAAGEIEGVSASAVIHDGKTCVAAVNRDFANEIEVTLPMNADVTIYHADALAENTIDTDVVEKQTVSGCKVVLPAGSFCIAIEK